MNLQYISENLKQQASIGLPILCFSITNNKLHITTKKVASRFFEHLTEQTKYIEFRVKHKISCSSDEILNGIEFYDYILEYFSSNSIISTDEFFNILNIDKLSDIANESFSNNWDVAFVTRNPIIRLLSGFVELSDSMMGGDSIDNTDIYNIVNSNVIQSQSNNTPFALKYFTIADSNEVLNYFSTKVDNIIITDEHTSNWNTFISYFLTKYKGKFHIIDIDNMNDMSQYGIEEETTSNKSVYLNWLEADTNRKHIIQFFHKLNYFLITDYTNYISITSTK
jgi:hypothetical protein